MARIREAAATSDGLPRKAFAYAPTATPADWKLPFLKADGTVDADRLPGAVAALSEGGFRGQKADIPSDALPMVKAKLRSAYRKWKGSDVVYPDTIKENDVALRESADGATVVRIREATILLDKSAVSATVISAPNGDMLVVPCYDGQFQQLAKDYESPSNDDSWQTSYDVADAGQLLSTLTRLRNHEMDEPEQVAMLDAAINAVANFIKAEATEPVSEAFAAIAEAGRRNSSADQKVLDAAHDALHDVGAKHDPKKTYKGMPDAPTPMSEAAAVREAEVIVNEAAKREPVAFAEASGAGPEAAFVTLAEAAATFDPKTRTVTITPIRPGFGNKKDGFYYPVQALKEATEAGLFNNLKMYRNHPKKTDEKDRPERDVNDWFATTREATWDAVNERPRVPVKVHEQKDFDRWEDAPDQIAFSVRGGGYAREGKAEGKDTKIIESLAKVRSVDWVTEAGAGGAIDFAESASEEFEMDVKSLSTAQLKEELRLREADEAADDPKIKTETKTATAEVTTEEKPAVAGSDAAGASPAGAATTAEGTALNETPPIAAGIESADAHKDDKADKGGEAPALAPEGYVSRAEFEAWKNAATIKESAAKAVKAEVAESTLIRAVKDVVAAKFAEASFGGGSIYTDEPALRAAVKGELATAARLLAAAGHAVPSPVKGLGGSAPEGEHSISESVKDRIESRWGSERLPTPQRTVYTAEDLGSDKKVVVTDGKKDADGEAVGLSEAAAHVQNNIAAKFGQA